MRKKLIKNVVLFFVGFCAYITIEWVYRGFSFLQMGCCGGIAIVILDKINNKLSWKVDILLQGLCGAALITFMELVIGELSLHTSVFQKMWDYSNVPLNFDGVICLPFSIVWFILSILAIMLADAINYYVFAELPIPHYYIFGYKFLCFKERK